MKTQTILLLVLFHISYNTLAQKQNDNWFFGNHCAVTFNSGSPVSLLNNAMVAYEGSATQSDNAGNLLFYTNGTNIYNANHVIMSNGSGLASDDVTSQGVLIVPKPGSSVLYYVFTTNTWENTPTDLRYSIVNLSLKSGLGDVSGVKNVLINNNIREQLTAVRHSNGIDFWIVVHEGFNHHFNAYRLSSSGLNMVPVVSDLGMDYTGGNRYGCLRFSHSCSKLVSVLGSTGPVNETVQVYDFNTSTGKVTNPVTIATYSTIPSAHSAEFSPNGSKLYITSIDETAVYQFDMQAQDIASTKINVAAGSPEIKSGLALARNGKIYVGDLNQSYLSAINSPDSSGLHSNFQNQAINFAAGNTCKLDLPNYIDYTCSSIVLPIELKSFYVTSIDKVVHIDWVTASEINNDHFIIERSTDNTNWEIIDRISGQGNSNHDFYYSEIDHHPLDGISYYRLLQFDTDGKLTVYGPVALKLNTNEIEVYPSPVKNDLTIKMNNARLFSVKIYSIQYIELNVQKFFNLNEVRLDLNGLANGIYILTILNDGNEIKEEKIIVLHN